MKFIDEAAFEGLIDPEPTTDYQRDLRSLVDTSSLIAR
jgi:glucose-1-phosphate thymidylyltransferase